MTGFLDKNRDALSPLVTSLMRGTCTGIFRSVVTKKATHARILEGILNGESRACVDSHRFF